MNPLPKAILLDFDGTLVDSEPLHYRCWAEAVRPWGGATDWADYQRRFVGITDREAARIFFTEAGYEPTAELIQAACDSKHQLYRASSAVELAIDEDLVAVIIELGLNLPIAIVTSSIELEVGPVLDKANLRPSIQVMVCGNHVKQHKPHPEPYELAFKQLNNQGKELSTSDCLVFEDSAAGVAAATAAGMRVSRVGHPSELPAQVRQEVGALLNGARV